MLYCETIVLFHDNVNRFEEGKLFLCLSSLYTDVSTVWCAIWLCFGFTFTFRRLEWFTVAFIMALHAHELAFHVD